MSTDGLIIENLFRDQAAALVSTLTRIFGSHNMDLAEEVVQDAMIRALEVWPYAGIPERPAAWLVQTAKNRALDVLRREARYRTILEENLQLLSRTGTDPEQTQHDSADDLPGMLFLCCHPGISSNARIALALKNVAGLSVNEIAAGFLKHPATIAQRIVRAKASIREKNIEFEIPEDHQLPERLSSVLETIYLWFNAGYAAHLGDHLLRLDLSAGAVRMGRLLASHPITGKSAETHALTALMMLQAARFPVRLDGEGNLLLLRDQDRSRWDTHLIHAGLHHLGRGAAGKNLSPYHLEAGIAACHATAPTYEKTDWAQIVELYDQLFELNQSPVVALNRAVARSRLHGADTGIAEIELLKEQPALAGYIQLPTILGELHTEKAEYEQAANYLRAALAIPCTTPHRRHLERRLNHIQHMQHRKNLIKDHSRV